MAEHTQDDDKAELIAQLDRARAQFARNLDGLRRDADVGAHLKHSFSAHKAAWIGSAGIAGWVLSRLPARKKKVIVNNEGGQAIKEIAEAGMLLTILKTLFTLFRPAIMGFASKKIADLAAKNDRWKK
jgi:hypothetical protein